MKYTGVKEVVITDLTTDMSVTLDEIGHETTIAIKEALEVEAADGTVFYAGEKSLVEFVTYNIDSLAQLVQWMQSSTPLVFTMSGFNFYLNWLEETPIEVYEHLFTQSGKLVNLLVRFKLEGGIHNIGATDLHYWTDGNGNYISDGNGNKIILLS